ncbi:MAG: choice-of-anchor M domain-containing protein [Planctomycetota bacterium]
MNRLVPTAALCAACAGGFQASGISFNYTEGHADLGMIEDGNELEPHFHSEDDAIINGVLTPDEEFEADEVAVIVPVTVLGTDFGTSDFQDIPEALGLTQGDQFYNLYQAQADANATSSPWLGLGTEEGDPLAFVGGTVDVALTGFTGPGQFALWRDLEGVVWDTLDGLAAEDEVTLLVGGEEHYHWAFTETGTYKIELTVTGTLVGETAPESASGTYTFVVVPEPSVAAMLGLGGLAALRRRRRHA